MLGLFALAAAAVAVATPNAGGWQVTDTTSALDGRPDYAAILEADTPIANTIGVNEPPLFGASCNKNGLFITVHWPDFVKKESFDDSSVKVTWKIDGGPIQRAAWAASLNAVSKIGPVGLKWFDGLAPAQKLIISVPDDHGGQEATFTLGGIAAIVAKLHTLSCG